MHRVICSAKWIHDPRARPQSGLALLELRLDACGHVHAELNEVKAVMAKHCVAVAMLFIYFSNEPAAFKSSEVFAMNAKCYRAFIAGSDIISAESKTCSSFNTDSIFRVRVFCTARVPVAVLTIAGPVVGSNQKLRRNVRCSS